MFLMLSINVLNILLQLSVIGPGWTGIFFLCNATLKCLQSMKGIIHSKNNL